VLEQYNIELKLFADDVKLYSRVLNNIDNIKLLCALDASVEWANSWQLIISIEKCCLMSIGNDSFTSNFNINGSTLHTVTSFRDLDVVMTHDTELATVNTYRHDGSHRSAKYTGRLFHTTWVY